MAERVHLFTTPNSLHATPNSLHATPNLFHATHSNSWSLYLVWLVSHWSTK